MIHNYLSLANTGNYTFMTLLGSIEPNWLCLTSNDTGNGGQWITIYAPTNKTTCDMIEHNCIELKPDKTSVEFYSLVAAFKLICKDGDKAKLIQVIQATGSVCIYTSIYQLSYLVNRINSWRSYR
jgi:hypothetical protein